MRRSVLILGQNTMSVTKFKCFYIKSNLVSWFNGKEDILYTIDTDREKKRERKYFWSFILKWKRSAHTIHVLERKSVWNNRKFGILFVCFLTKMSTGSHFAPLGSRVLYAYDVCQCETMSFTSQQTDNRYLCLFISPIHWKSLSCRHFP